MLKLPSKVLLCGFLAVGGAIPTATYADDLVVWHTQDNAQAALLAELIREFEKSAAWKVKLETGMEIEAALLTLRPRPWLLYHI